MLADNPTWPKKKSELIEEAVVTPPQGQGIGVPTPPPFPTQAPAANVAKNCPFCGGVMSSMYVPPNPPMGSVGTPAMMTVGCHNVACGIAPKMKCYSADLPMVLQLWNYRCP